MLRVKVYAIHTSSVGTDVGTVTAIVLYITTPGVRSSQIRWYFSWLSVLNGTSYLSFSKTTDPDLV